MAKAGDEFVNPVTRLRTVFRKTAQDASVEQLHVDWIGDPGCRYSGYFQDLDGHLSPMVNRLEPRVGSQ